MIVPIVLTTFLAMLGPVADTPAAPAHLSPPRAPFMSDDGKIGRRVKAEFSAWQHGSLDRTRYSHEANEQFSSGVIDAISTHLKQLGAVRSAISLVNYKDGDSTVYVYSLRCENGRVRMKIGLDSLGKIDIIAFEPD